MDESHFRPRIESLDINGGNYNPWQLGVAGSLLRAGVIDAIRNPPPTDKTKITPELQKSYDTAYGIITQYLSIDVQNDLPADCKDYLSPAPFKLWQTLKTRYSSASAARLAQLIREMLYSKVPPGENPGPVFATMRSAHSQLAAAGEKMSDAILGHAMLEALSDEDWHTQKETYFLWSEMKSEAVASSVRTVWSKKQEDKVKAEKADAAAAALVAKVVAKGKCRIHPNSQHSDAQCVTQGATPPPGFQFRKNKNNNKEKTPAAANFSHASAYCSAYAAEGEKRFDEMFVDTGANEHMVHDPSILSDIRPPTDIRKVKVGSGQLLPVAAVGDLQLGDWKAYDVLVVPDLTVNLLSVSKTPKPYYWQFDQTGAVLNTKAHQTVLRAPVRDGLYVIED